MARKPRKFVESGVYHVIMRGNDQQNIFYDDSDRSFFVKRLEKYTKETKIELYAYCLMDNHVHLLIGKGNKNMPLLIKKLACSYVYRFNHKYERTGHLFQGRYISEAIETVDYFKTAHRYILRNPEAARMCDFRHYRWNSYYQNKRDLKKKNSFILSLYESEANFEDFLSSAEYESDNKKIFVCNKYENDDDLKVLFIKQLLGIQNLLSLNKEDVILMKNHVRLLKKCGISINQIARLTGINRYYIRNA